EHEAEDQRGPAPDRHRLRPWMPALAGDVARHHPKRDNDSDERRNEHDQNDPGEDVDERHGDARVKWCRARTRSQLAQIAMRRCHCDCAASKFCCIFSTTWSIEKLAGRWLGG